MKFITIESYGKFTIFYSAYVLILTLHNSIILETISVFGSKLNKDELRLFTGSSLIFHLVFSYVIGIPILIFSYFFSKIDFSTLILVIVFIPVLLIPWFLRQYFYVLKKNIYSNYVSFIFTISLIIFLFIYFSIFHDYSLFWVFLLLISSSFLSSLIMWRFFDFKIDLSLLSQHFILQKTYIKKSVFLNFFTWCSSNIYLYLISYFVNHSLVGIIKGLLIVIQPVLQILRAITFYFLPESARIVNPSKKCQ